jgi:hypothetical protein
MSLGGNENEERNFLNLLTDLQRRNGAAFFVNEMFLIVFSIICWFVVLSLFIKRMETLISFSPKLKGSFVNVRTHVNLRCHKIPFLLYLHYPLHPSLLPLLLRCLLGSLNGLYQHLEGLLHNLQPLYLPPLLPLLLLLLLPLW